ncbi:MFS transporter [Lonepinella koalarum]|uniref:MFS transporter n=1 Tax=Lonepinella koalarum TaxID=53417 RepID=UPI003F6E3273
MNSSAVSTKGKLNFGKQGWLVVILQACIFWVVAGCTTHGLNVILPGLSETYHLDYNQLLMAATPAAWLAIPAAPFCSWLIQKKGIKFNLIFCLIGCIISYGLLGYCSSITSFVICFGLESFFATGFGYIGGTALIANWFVKKQSLALGFCTFGQTFSSAFFVPVLAWSFATFTFQNGFWLMSVLMAIILFVVIFFVANRPEDVGLLPDNEDSSLITQTIQQEKVLDEYPYLNFRTLLKMKDVWLIGAVRGLIYIVLVGVTAQIIPRLVSLGLELNQAITYMSGAALFGTFGAYTWGWLNDKLGIKVAFSFYTIWWIIAIILNIIPESQTALLVSLGMIGLALPGATNYCTAFTSAKFPRSAYAKAMGIAHPIESVLRCCAFSIVAFGLAYLGGYTGAYLLLIAIGVITIMLIWLTNLTPLGPVQSNRK